MSKDAVQPLALRPRDAARALGVSESTLARLKSSGDLPFVRLGTSVLFAVDDLRAWLASRRQTEGGATPSSAA